MESSDVEAPTYGARLSGFLLYVRCDANEIVISIYFIFIMNIDFVWSTAASWLPCLADNSSNNAQYIAASG